MLDQEQGTWLEDEESGPAFSLSVTSDILKSDRHAARRLLYVSLLAQGGALLAAKTAVAPLERLKVLRQVESGKDHVPKLFDDRFWYRGFSHKVAHTVLGNFARMYLLSRLRGESEISAYAISAFVASSLVYPWDVKYTLAATGVTVVPKFFSRPSFTGFTYHGAATPLYLATAVGVVNTARATGIDEKKFPTNILVGSVAALAGSIATYPLNTLRIRAIVGNLSRVNLFSGLSVHVARAVPECFVLGAVYSELIKLNYL